MNHYYHDQEISPLAWWQHVLPQIQERSWYGEQVQVEEHCV